MKTFGFGFLLISFTAIMVSGGATYAGTCPAVGASNDCGIIITITNTGATPVPTGIGPYDSIEDTLIGVINNSILPVSSIDLKGTVPIFGFDGDGITAYGIPGNANDGTGYGGPNAYFSNMSPDQLSGRVNFITPIPAKGGISYFSLEGAISGATACSTIINNSVPKPKPTALRGDTSISATFMPNQSDGSPAVPPGKPGFTLAQAAQLCGFADWDWQQTITNLPKPSPFCAKGSLLCNPATFIGHFFTLHARPSFNDPPTPHGYTYQDPSVCRDPPACTRHYQSDDPNPLPLYFNPLLPSTNMWSLADDFGKRTSSSLFWYDAPTNPCLYGGLVSSYCYGGGTAPFGSTFAFTTHLVGLQGTSPNYSIVDTGVGFDWDTTFNGTSGGIAVTSSFGPVDPGSGTGGITVTNYNGITTLTGTAVSAINGVPTGPGGTMTLPALTPSQGQPDTPCNGAYSGTFNGSISVSSGQTCTFVNGTINGDINVNGGNLNLQGDSVSGNVRVTYGGAFSISEFTSIEGELKVNNLGRGSTKSQICSATIYGNLSVNGNKSDVDIGGAPPSSCLGNVIAKNLHVDANSGATSVSGNSVTSNLQIIHNSGATQVFNNAILGNLICAQDPYINGGGNTAHQKLGPCSTF